MRPAIPGIAAKIYRKSKRGLDVIIDLDDATGKVFAAIDGHAPLPIVAESAGIGIPVLWRAIAKLTRLGLIEEAAGSADTMGKPFADKLHQELTRAVGPMSNVLIQSVVKMTKITWPYIPPERARELIDRIVAQIPNDSLKEKFHETMLKEL
jgi:hypothetical protein